MPEGVISELWRYPVKSMGGERVRSARVDWRGMGGDRTHALLFEHKGVERPLTAREAPRMLAFRASYPFAPDAGLDPARPPDAQVIAPDGARYGFKDPRLKRVLHAELGRDVALHRDVDGVQDLPRTLLLTTAATHRALEAELGPVDLRRFRTNVHLDLDSGPWDELGWEGRRVRFESGVVLQLLHPCVRCAIPNRDPDTQEKWPALLRHLAAEHETVFGINARVVVAGRIAAGQRAEIA